MWDQCLENGVATLACIPIIIKNVINAALVFAGVVTLILVIFSAFQYTTSKGDQAKIDTAKKTMTYAILGLVIVLMSFFIVTLISQLTGVSQIANPTL